MEQGGRCGIGAAGISIERAKNERSHVVGKNREKELSGATRMPGKYGDSTHPRGR